MCDVWWIAAFMVLVFTYTYMETPSQFEYVCALCTYNAFSSLTLNCLAVSFPPSLPMPLCAGIVHCVSFYLLFKRHELTIKNHKKFTEKEMKWNPTWQSALFTITKVLIFFYNFSLMILLDSGNGNFFLLFLLVFMIILFDSVDFVYSKN